MNLKIKPIAGLIRTRDHIDRTLRSQGFACRASHPPVYDIRIQDSASGVAYRLRIPIQAHSLTNSGKKGSMVRLGTPRISRNNGGSQLNQEVPSAIMEAANHKIAEIASYLNNPTIQK
ncbi:hypothetical protein [Paludifilum halophilum]|uniref:Uncharacterized protein n=1 Tax=Paludifilum halophilum TaxID=1642702 RepID=A0A235B6D4_9BACL|nr:hypothetical protein [Paludifilum halophilum]OYD07792.1 hypothetical protein CHM34_10030 [Paludifilum halophilum]